MEGQVTIFPCDKISPCYRCIHPKPSFAEGCRSCANAGNYFLKKRNPVFKINYYYYYFIGVLGPVPGLIGSLQAIETIKLLTRMDQNYYNNSSGINLFYYFVSFYCIQFNLFIYLFDKSIIINWKTNIL